MDRNAWGLDKDARIVSVNDLFDLSDRLAEIWEEKFEQARAEQDPWKSSRLYGEVDGIDRAGRTLHEFIGQMVRRMPREQG